MCQWEAANPTFKHTFFVHTHDMSSASIIINPSPKSNTETISEGLICVQLWCWCLQYHELQQQLKPHCCKSKPHRLGAAALLLLLNAQKILAIHGHPWPSWPIQSYFGCPFPGLIWSHICVSCRLRFITV